MHMWWTKWFPPVLLATLPAWTVGDMFLGDDADGNTDRVPIAASCWFAFVSGIWWVMGFAPAEIWMREARLVPACCARAWCMDAPRNLMLGYLCCRSAYTAVSTSQRDQTWLLSGHVPAWWPAQSWMSCGATDVWSLMNVSDASSFLSLVRKNWPQLPHGAPVGFISGFPLFTCVIVFFKWWWDTLLFLPHAIQLLSTLSLKVWISGQAAEFVISHLLWLFFNFYYTIGILSGRTLRSASLLLEHFPSSHLTDFKNSTNEGFLMRWRDHLKNPQVGGSSAQ